jgi:hypothetical protein
LATRSIIAMRGHVAVLAILLWVTPPHHAILAFFLVVICWPFPLVTPCPYCPPPPALRLAKLVELPAFDCDCEFCGNGGACPWPWCTCPCAVCGIMEGTSS